LARIINTYTQMSLEITLVCEYIFEKDECLMYIQSINVNRTEYDHIYDQNYYKQNIDKKKKNKNTI
jgi:hypothetical protein